MESRVRVALLDLRAGFVRSRWLGFAHGLTRHTATGTLTGARRDAACGPPAGGKITVKMKFCGLDNTPLCAHVYAECWPSAYS